MSALVFSVVPFTKTEFLCSGIRKTKTALNVDPVMLENLLRKKSIFSMTVLVLPGSCICLPDFVTYIPVCRPHAPLAMENSWVVISSVRTTWTMRKRSFSKEICIIISSVRGNNHKNKSTVKDYRMARGPGEGLLLSLSWLFRVGYATCR